MRGVPSFGFPKMSNCVGFSSMSTLFALAEWSTRAAMPMPFSFSAASSRSIVSATP